MNQNAPLKSTSKCVNQASKKIYVLNNFTQETKNNDDDNHYIKVLITLKIRIKNSGHQKKAKFYFVLMTQSPSFNLMKNLDEGQAKNKDNYDDDDDDDLQFNDPSK
ncbi:hypothetical protein DERP_008885 [Dermatophagoides pteronyssinus]|uniref:Uncharacterized protein n=1 Tax=Dermatophagoides pteronyssinus TaxID=6956 RepID=A0ABQ8JNG3_DERPT|nr:hypothetical protein DERP_008885 [Dermatophagoides pteronyssinus]